MMNFLILLLLSPAVICSQRQRKSTNPNEEPFLPIHPDYPYNPKLMKRGLEQQQQHQQQYQQQYTQQTQPQTLAQLTPELFAPKVDSRDSYAASYAQNPYYGSYDSYNKGTTTANALAASPYYQSAYSSYNANPYNLINSYGSPYAAASTQNAYGANNAGYGASPYTAAGASPYSSAAASPYTAAGASPYSAAGASPYSAAGAFPNYFYQPPYYYPNYYGQPPYPPPPPGYHGSAPSKHQNDDEDEDEIDRPREKSKKSGHHKNKLRNSDSDNQYVDGGNFIISSSKDLDGESSTHRTPALYNQIESDSDVHPRTAPLPKATYRLVSVSGQPDYNSAPGGYIKVQQLEQLMRQALARLLAQNAAQQANLAQIQQEATQTTKDGHQYLSQPNTGIAKTGLSYVVNPTILNRVNAGQYNPSQLIQTQSKQPYGQKSGTSVTLQQSHGIYIPPSKTNSPAEYEDYESSDSVTPRTQQATAEPTRYPYSTYRPTERTSLEDVNFGSKKSKS